jgi:2-oxoacid:acceptor oxidoreductase delta subunit (pyruvate/2-ketoisovalerate family)
MRYDDSPERDNIPMIFYTVMGKPNVNVVLHEEVEPIGQIFDAIVVMDSSMLIHPTSQRTRLFDGAKENAVLVVDTSLSPEEIAGLVTKYCLVKDWNARLVTVRARAYDKEIAYPLLAALTKAWKTTNIGHLEIALDNAKKSQKAEVVRRVYDEVKPVDVSLRVDPRSAPAKTRLTGPPTPRRKGWWDLETYRKYSIAASQEPSYSGRLTHMPSWEVLAPGLIEFGPGPGEKNVGFKTSFERFVRPVIDRQKCTDCRLCHLYCPDGAIDHQAISVDLDYCTGCGICAQVCPVKAVTLVGELEAREGLREEETSTIAEALREYGY